MSNRNLLKLIFSALLWPGMTAPVVRAQVSRPPLRWQLDVPVRMRDGVVLATDVFLPEKEARYPVILVRTPYGKRSKQDDGLFFVQHGYALVVQDTRGRNESDGEWYAFSHEAEDGYDTIEWAANQLWSDGKVVTRGGSYLAIDQWLAATQGNSHLAAMVSFVSPSDLYANTIHPGGAFQYGTGLTWSFGTGRHRDLYEQATLIPWPAIFRTLPAESAAAAAGYEANFYRDWIEHPGRDAYWRSMSWQDVYSRLSIPVMHIGGWFDIFQEGTIENFEKMTRDAPPAARRAQRLVVGPWAHGAFEAKVGEVDFGKQSVVVFRLKELRWLDHYVKGVPNGAENDLPVEIFAMGSKEWKKEKTWPPAGTKPLRLFFHSHGKANSVQGEGVLSAESPGDEQSDRFDYDPADPVPTMGGGTCCDPALMPWGPLDQRKIEERNDVLVYSTPPLDHDLEAAGPVEVHLFASSSARDTDWTAKLVDVAPAGFAMNLTDGILRARFRRSFERPELLEPDKIYEFVVNSGNTDNVFLRGHRLRLEISSSNFPHFSRNTNTGNVPEKEANYLTAHQTVYHDRERASFLLLLVNAER